MVAQICNNFIETLIFKNGMLPTAVEEINNQNNCNKVMVYLLHTSLKAFATSGIIKELYSINEHETEQK